jgi:hypothetical protein
VDFDCGIFLVERGNTSKTMTIRNNETEIKPYLLAM